MKKILVNAGYQKKIKINLNIILLQVAVQVDKFYFKRLDQNYERNRDNQAR